MGKVIGIDLGTTNSVVAYMDGATPRIVVNEEGARTTPSVVAFSPDGEHFVGEVAKRQLVIHPERTVHSVKRLIGRRFDAVSEETHQYGYEVVKGDTDEAALSVLGTIIKPPEVSGYVLRKLRKAAEDFLGETITDAVITVPAYFTDPQRNATCDAAAIAGLNVVRIINEPTAAALAYLSERKKSARIAVYDFGGGTFDISILNVEEGVAEVLATAGDNRLGGNDLDECITAWLASTYQDEYDQPVPDDRVVHQRLREAAERAKIELSAVLETEIHLPFLTVEEGSPRHLKATLGRAKLEDLISGCVQKTLDACKQVMDDCQLRSGDIDEVILVGGSSRIPEVQRKVEAFFGATLNKSFNPDEVVAAGAAIQGGILTGETKEITLLDVTSFSLGIEVEGQRTATIIPKNSIVPVSRSQLVSTVSDRQDSVQIHVLQGEERRSAGNVSLGRFELGNLTQGRRGEPRIEVCFTIDANGILQVSAEDTKTRSRHAIIVEHPMAMSSSSIAESRANVESHALRAELSRELAEQRHRVERQLFDLEDFLRKNKHDLRRKDLSEADQALKRGRMGVHNSSDIENMRALESYLENFSSELKARAAEK